jgi:hypothetical protein
VQGNQGFVELYLLSLTTGERHSRPVKEKLEHTFGENTEQMLLLQGWDHTLQICENLLCIHHECDLNEYVLDTLAIWDWTKGELVMVSAHIMTQEWREPL